jgi:hypothetical protein
MPSEITLVPKVHGPLSVYPIEFARHFGVSAFVTDRFGGVSVARTNRSTWATTLTMTPNT